MDNFRRKEYFYHSTFDAAFLTSEWKKKTDKRDTAFISWKIHEHEHFMHWKGPTDKMRFLSSRNSKREVYLWVLFFYYASSHLLYLCLCLCLCLISLLTRKKMKPFIHQHSKIFILNIEWTLQTEEKKFGGWNFLK